VGDETGSEVGERFARAGAARDGSALLTLLTPDVDFRGMTPNRVWEAKSASVDAATVVDRHRVGYRFRLTNPDGTFAVEQQAYYEVDGARISWLRIMCSGYRAIQDGSVAG
jgi:hypothetical protein